MREFVRGHRFSEDTIELLQSVVAVVRRYQAQGLRLTLRQLYYQLVSRNRLSNVERQYKRLSGLLSDARLVGLVDWEAIEDRIRQPRKAPEFSGLPELVEAALASYRLPRWEGQKAYVELWVEKDALAGVLAPIAREYHVTLMVNRGYSSQSAMYDSAKRFLLACYGPLTVARATIPMSEWADGEKPEKADNDDPRVLDVKRLGRPLAAPILLYLGDHDPSGEDMVRDIEARLRMFGIAVDVRKLALTRGQIIEHRPPPNPAKTTDPRSQKYIDEHGDQSWEVDALPPDVLDRIVRDAIEEIVDWPKMRKVLDREKADKKALMKAVATISKKDK